MEDKNNIPVDLNNDDERIAESSKKSVSKQSVFIQTAIQNEVEDVEIAELEKKS